MHNSICPSEKPALKELLEASKSAERLISALFEVGALQGEPFMSIWCQLERAIDRTHRTLKPEPALEHVSCEDSRLDEEGQHWGQPVRGDVPLSR
jgi:hypothetical protein